MKSFLNFIKEVKHELVKVVWPSQQEVVRFTGLVVFISLAVALIIGGADLAFVKILNLFIK